MLRRPQRGRTDGPTLLLVANDPRVIAAAEGAAALLHAGTRLRRVSGTEALMRLIGPGERPSHLVIEAALADEALISTARDRFLGLGVVVVRGRDESTPAGLRGAPAAAAALAAALRRSAAPAGARGPMPDVDAGALARGLARGEITVRFQPMVRLSDRRPMILEALARWERPALALGAGAFVALAERGGLAMPLALGVADRALADLAGAGIAGLKVSVNVSLTALLHPHLPTRLAEVVAARGFRPADLLIELTENTLVRDTALLRRALQRLARGGFRVLLDDLGMDDRRGLLLHLPFAGVKLDRSLIAALPTSRRARAQVERLSRAARREISAVVAEGVSDPLLWRMAAAAGCDLAQGLGVGRPIPAVALPAWLAAWRGAALPPDQPE
jgi:EAL domain-containing protein (putative c-di-GMP-specific phosphodiesterase class I)